MSDSPMQRQAPKKEWGLTPSAFRLLLDWLDEPANSEGQGYLETRRRLVAYFDRRNCLTPDELADETLNRVARRLEEEGSIESETPAKYCYIVSSVNFATSDSAGSQPCNVFNGNASSRCDYLISFGTVKFAAGETSKNISIPIIDDSYAEGNNETFTVSLNNPSGASLGQPSTTQVTIVDNDSPSGPNPVDQSTFFVRQHYLDFLNREPDTSGLSFWVNNIDSCGADSNCRAVKRIDTSAAFFLSIEFQQTGYLVERIYKASYGDASGASTLGGAHQLSVPIVRLNESLPDTQEIGRGVVVGQGNWQQQLENNKQAFTLEFVQRTRFITAFETSMTPAQFVDKLFLNAGGTPAGSVRTG